MHKINQDKARMLTDTVESYGWLRWCWVQSWAKEPGGGYSCCSVWAASVTACCKTNTECYFCFLTFFIKAKILFRFLLVSENRYLYFSLIKVEWSNENWEIGEYLYQFLFLPHWIRNGCHVFFSHLHTSCGLFLWCPLTQVWVEVAASLLYCRWFGGGSAVQLE